MGIHEHIFLRELVRIARRGRKTSILHELSFMMGPLLTAPRRRREKPLDTVNHWWHRDLSDPQVVATIGDEFGRPVEFD